MGRTEEPGDTLRSKFPAHNDQVGPEGRTSYVELREFCAITFWVA